MDLPFLPNVRFPMARSPLFMRTAGFLSADHRHMGSRMMDSNRAGFRPHRRGGVVRLLAGRCLLLAAVLTAAAGCDQDPASLPPPDKPTDKAANGIVHLTEAEIARGGIEVLPVQKAPFTCIANFGHHSYANENELAEVTTLIRGRVVEVLVDVGETSRRVNAWPCSTVRTWAWRRRLSQGRRSTA